MNVPKKYLEPRFLSSNFVLRCSSCVSCVIRCLSPLYLAPHSKNAIGNMRKIVYASWRFSSLVCASFSVDFHSCFSSPGFPPGESKVFSLSSLLVLLRNNLPQFVRFYSLQVGVRHE